MMPTGAYMDPLAPPPNLALLEFWDPPKHVSSFCPLWTRSIVEHERLRVETTEGGGSKGGGRRVRARRVGAPRDPSETCLAEGAPVVAPEAPQGPEKSLQGCPAQKKAWCPHVGRRPLTKHVSANLHVAPVSGRAAVDRWWYKKPIGLVLRSLCPINARKHHRPVQHTNLARPRSSPQDQLPSRPLLFHSDIRGRDEGPALLCLFSETQCEQGFPCPVLGMAPSPSLLSFACLLDYQSPVSSHVLTMIRFQLALQLS